MNPNRYITEYFRRNRIAKRDKETNQILKDACGKTIKHGGKKVGAMAAAMNGEGKIMIGWSLAHRQLEPLGFDPGFAMKLAIDRTQANTLVDPPRSMKLELAEFAARAKRYFKECEVIEIK